MDPIPRPRSELFMRADIENMLRAIDQANAQLAVQIPIHQVAIYRSGFAAALSAVARAFDVSLDQRDPPLEQDLFRRHLPAGREPGRW